jgi:hypothetical protein
MALPASNHPASLPADNEQSVANDDPGNIFIPNGLDHNQLNADVIALSNDLITGRAAAPGGPHADLAEAVTALKNASADISARVRRAAVQSIATGGAGELIVFDTEDYDTDDLFTASSDTLTIATDGKYSLKATATFAGNATGVRRLLLNKNGAPIDIARDNNPTAGNDSVLHLGTDHTFIATDTLTVNAFQDSGGALNLISAFFSVSRLPG